MSTNQQLNVALNGGKSKDEYYFGQNGAGGFTYSKINTKYNINFTVYY